MFYQIIRQNFYALTYHGIALLFIFESSAVSLKGKSQVQVVTGTKINHMLFTLLKIVINHCVTLCFTLYCESVYNENMTLLVRFLLRILYIYRSNVLLYFDPIFSLL